MKTQVIHVYYDPLCAHTYGAGKLIQKLKKSGQVHIELHGVGLYSPTEDDGSPMVSQFLKDSAIRNADVNKRAGVEFSSEFENAVRSTGVCCLNSLLGISAIETCKILGGDEVEMLLKLQALFFKDARPVASIADLVSIAEELNLPGDMFQTEVTKYLSNSATDHIEENRDFLQSNNLSGVPAFAIAEKDKVRVINKDYAIESDWSELPVC